MNIERAKITYADWINEVIQREFPYTAFTPQHIEERITNPKYSVLVMRQENINVGFTETEWFAEVKKARLNCVYVEEAWRGQGFGRRLTEQAINDCKHTRVDYLYLLVRSDNFGAKHMYKELGFDYAKMHDKIIDGNEVEVWDLNI